MAHVKPPFPVLQRGKFVSDGLVAAYPFYEGGGSTLHDVSGDKNHGTLTDGPTWTGGRSGHALDFDGVDDYVTINAGLITRTGTTISAWAKHNNSGISNEYIICHRGEAGGNSRTYILVNSSDQLSVFLGSGASVATAFTAGVWHHVALSFQDEDLNGSGIYTLYMDGYEVDSGSYADFTLTKPYVTLGCFNNGDGISSGAFWDGLIGETRIYNRTLDANEIKLITAGLG